MKLSRSPKHRPPKRAPRWSVLAALGPLVTSFVACSCGGRGRAPSSPDSASSATTTAASASTAVPPSASASASSATAVGARPPVDLASIRPLASEPAVAGLDVALGAKDYAAAVVLLEASIASGKLSGARLDQARFSLGRAAAAAKDKSKAFIAYQSVSTSAPLRPFAALRAAAFALEANRPAEALTLLADVPELPSIATDRHLALGDALAATNELAKAAQAYGAERRSSRWVEASIRFAETVARMPGVDESLAKEAAQAARRVRFEAPTSSLVGRAILAEQDARAKLADKAVPAPTDAERRAQALATLEAGKAKDALPLLDAARATTASPSAERCRIDLAIARAHERLRARRAASDAYGQAALDCTDVNEATTALYDGAKAALGAKLPEVAKARFAELERRFPTHRLADDARVRRAQLLVDGGDVAGGEAAWLTVPSDFPAGDMGSEALFRVALPRMKRGEWKEARPILERALAVSPHEDGYFTAGRTRYFLGRAELETGAGEKGRTLLLETLREAPLSFAAAMAYARLCSAGGDACDAAKRTIEESMASEPAGSLVNDHRPELATESAARAVALAEVGETEWAKRELNAAGLGKDAKEDPEAAYLSATILASAGELRAAHAITRSRVVDWSRHFPSGRWRAAWALAFPRPWDAIVSAQSAKTGVPAGLIDAVMREESAFEPEVVSPSDAYGLLQLIVPTAAHYAKPLGLPSTPADLVKPEINIPLGSAYLAKLLAEFPQQPAYAVPSYNAGEGATHRWLSPPLASSFDLWVESIPYDETRKYTKRVLASYYAYVALYDPSKLHEVMKAAAGR
jgi:soluble lytic murein transglycosylase